MLLGRLLFWHLYHCFLVKCLTKKNESGEYIWVFDGLLTAFWLIEVLPYDGPFANFLWIVKVMIMTRIIMTSVVKLLLPEKVLYFLCKLITIVLTVVPCVCLLRAHIATVLFSSVLVFMGITVSLWSSKDNY